jgi:hypothetical protein
MAFHRSLREALLASADRLDEGANRLRLAAAKVRELAGVSAKWHRFDLSGE